MRKLVGLPRKEIEAAAFVLETSADYFDRNAGAWIQELEAATKDGQETDVGDSDAVCFCSLGIIERNAPTSFVEDVAQGYLADILPNKRLSAAEQIYRWNDRRSRRKGEIVAKFREAAANARAHLKEIAA